MRRALLLAGLWLLALLCFSVFSQPRQNAQLALVGGTIYVSPTAAPIPNGVVLIRAGQIAAVGRRESVKIPQGTETLDCAGLAVVAGFWNSHVHFMERKWADAAKTPVPDLSRQLQAMLTQYGVTSVFDTGSRWENTRQLRDRIESGEIPGPRIRSVGEALFAKGSFSTADAPVADALGFMRYVPSEVADAAEAAAVTGSHLDAGTDGIKVYAANYFPPFLTLPESVIRAAVQEAHVKGKPAFAHPTTRDGLLTAVRAGVDIIAHVTPEAGPWDETVLRTMREARVSLIPTLKLFAYEQRHDLISGSDKATATAVGQLRAWVDSGGEVLFGTDVGYMSDYDPSEEYVLMAQAGMTFRQILASLTTAPAARFGESSRGQVVPGFAADLVVLDRDPSRDIRALATVRYTLRAGKLIYRSSTDKRTASAPDRD